MKDYKNLLVYAIVAAAVAIGVAYMLSSQLSSTYSISVTMTANVPANAYPFETAYFRADVNNTGTGTAASVPFLIYLNGNPIGSYKVTLPGGKGGVVAWNYTFPYNGTYQFQAIVDPGHLFRISNRSSTHAAITVNVSPAQPPLPYTAIPNGNITSTHSFAILRNGSAAITAVALDYNVSILNNMLGPAHSVMLRTLQDLSGTINLVKGAIAYYPSNQIAYTAWLQGTLNPSLVEAVVNSFSIPQTGISINGTHAAFSRVSNTTSMCFYYSGGWTKVISYYNATRNVTCRSIAASTYSGNANTLAMGTGNTTSRLKALSANFVYANSTYLGSSLSYQNGTYGATSVFSNPYGIFMSYVQRNANPVDISVNQSCNGIVYPSGNVFVCSSAVSPIPNGNEYLDLLNETEVAQNYTARLYSFVNRTDIIQANEAGIQLILSLNLSPVSAKWNSPFVNTCGIANVTIFCRVNAFSHTNYTATFGITNGMASAMRLNTLSCAAPGEKQPVNVSRTIIPGQTINVTTTCRNIPAPIQSISTTYNLGLNYTVSGITTNVTGQVVIINQPS